MDKNRVLEYFVSLLLAIANCSKLDYINLDAFVAHLYGCYVNLIFYQVLDFQSPSIPIALISARQDVYGNKTRCSRIAKNAFGVGDRYIWNVNNDICPYVLNNYNIKGIYCVAAVGVLPPSIDESGRWREESDIYWYLNHYWSRADTHDVSFSSRETGKRLKRAPVSHSAFFPTEIHIHVIMTTQSFQIRTETAKNETEIIPEWVPYSKLPTITILVGEEDFAMKNIPCRITLSIGKSPYFWTYLDAVGTKNGKTSIFLLKALA